MKDIRIFLFGRRVFTDAAMARLTINASLDSFRPNG